MLFVIRRNRLPRRADRWRLLALVALAGVVLFGALLLVAGQPVPAQAGNGNPGGAAPTGEYKLIGWNDLGMHCMNESFANLAVLPPYNTLWAQLIRQGPAPQIITSSVTIEYSIVDNTYSAGKTDFWQYVKPLFGVDLAPNVGLNGAMLAGAMHPPAIISSSKVCR